MLLETSGCQENVKNLMAQRLADEWGVTVSASTENTVARSVLRLKCGQLLVESQKPKQPSIGQQAAAVGISAGVQAAGNAVSGAAYRHGGTVAGTAAGAATQGAANAASQKAQRDIYYKSTRRDMDQLVGYEVCVGLACKGVPANLYMSVQNATDGTGQWHQYTLLRYGNDKDEKKLLNPETPIFLGEGQFQTPPLEAVQEALFGLLITEASGAKRLQGAKELAALRDAVLAVPKAPSTLPAVTTPAAADASQAPAVKMEKHPGQVWNKRTQTWEPIGGITGQLPNERPRSVAAQTAEVQQLREQVAVMQKQLEEMRAAGALPKQAPTPKPKPTATPAAEGVAPTQQDPVPAVGVAYDCSLVAGKLLTLRFTKTYKRKDTGQEVREFQLWAATMGLIHLDPKIDIPGLFGEKTEAAAKQLQRCRELEQTGELDLPTIKLFGGLTAPKPVATKRSVKKKTE